MSEDITRVGVVEVGPVRMTQPEAGHFEPGKGAQGQSGTRPEADLNIAAAREGRRCRDYRSIRGAPGRPDIRRGREASPISRLDPAQGSP
jgi:hypothetical protein